MACSGFSVFFSIDISIESIIAYNQQSMQVFNPNLPITFYINQKAFTKAGYLSLSSPHTISTNTTPLPSTTNEIFTGIMRPSLTTYYKSTTSSFVTTDKAAFFCTSNVSTDMNILTNYIPAIASFALDYNPDNTTTWTNTLIKSISNEFFHFDISSDLYMQFSLQNFDKSNIMIPKKTIFRVDGSGGTFFNSNTICGIYTGIETTSLVTDCTRTPGVSKSYDCEASSHSTNFTVCCYNIMLQDNIQLTSMKAIMSKDTNIPNIQNYVSEDIFISPTTSMTNFGWDNVNKSPFLYNSNLPNLSVQYAIIEEIKYDIQQENALGVAIFKLRFPKAIPRNGKIIIQGDFSAMTSNIDLSLIRCIPTSTLITGYYLSQDIKEKDMFFDNCSIGNINSKTESIVINIKKFIYKCDLILSNVMYLTIYPLVLINFNSAANVNNTYNVSLYLNGDNASVLNNDNYSTMPRMNYNLSKPPLAFVNKLFSVSMSTLQTGNELVDVNFSFDLSKIDSKNLALTNRRKYTNLID